MMTWNYRLVKRAVDTPESLGGGQHYTYGIHEAYYNDDGEVWGLTTDPVHLSADHINELKLDWLRLMEAFVAPVLDYDDVCNNATEPPFKLPDDAFDEMDASIDIDDLAEELDLEPLDSKAYSEEMAEQNEQEEFQHAEEYVGSPLERIHALIIGLRSQNP